MWVCSFVRSTELLFCLRRKNTLCSCVTVLRYVGSPSTADDGHAENRSASHSSVGHLQCLLGYLNQNFRDSMFDFLVLIISKSRVLFDEYSAACIQASQLASSTLQSVDVGICDLNKLIADTTQFELVSFDRSAYRQGSIAVSSIVFELVAKQQHRPSIDHAACIASRRTNEIDEIDNDEQQQQQR